MFKATITSLVLACVLMTAPAQAMEEIATGWLDNKAVGGYDTVAYHTQAKAVNGKDAFRSVWKATAWYFASEENLNAFEATPENTPRNMAATAHGIWHKVNYCRGHRPFGI